MSERKLSFIVPIFNSDKTIDRCIKSILNQSYNNIELILINDGSIDNTSAICEQYVEKDKRIIYLYKENSGVSDTRNKGLSLATGDYIAFVDSDDYIEKDFAESLIKVIEDNDVDIAFCDARDIYSNKIITNSKNDNNVFVFNSNDFEFWGNKRHEVVWGAIYKKEILKNVCFDKKIYIGEDTLFFSEAVVNSNKIAHLEKILYNYVIYDNSAVHSKEFNEKKITHVFAYEKLCDVFKDKKIAYLSARTRYGEICLNTLLKYKNDNLFKIKYKKLTIKAYRNNVPYIIKFYFKKRRFKTIIKHFNLFVFIRLFLFLNNE